MGTVSEKLVYLNDTKTKLRNGINRIGGTIDTDDTFRSYVDELNDIYQDMPKVTDTGTSITLNNTRHGGLELGLSGNTYQETTTGKQLFNKNGSFALTGVSVSALNTGIRVTITTAGNFKYATYKFGESEILGKTFSYNVERTSSSSNVSSFQVFYGSSSNNAVQRITTTAGTFTIDNSFPEGCDRVNFLFYANVSGTGNLNDYADFINLMVVEGTYTSSNFPDYEPYTNGASPNPNYPQDIHVVSGDNEINVVGKNLLDEEYYKNATYGSNVYKYTPLKFKGDRTLYFKTILKSGKTSISGLYLAVSNKNNPNLTGNKSYFLISNGTINPTASNYYDFTGEDNLYLDYYPISVTPQDIFNTYNIIVSLENADYEPYVSSSYQVNLPVENLAKPTFDKPWGISGSGNTRTITTNSTFKNRAQVVKVKPSTKYTCSGDFSIMDTNYIRILNFDSEPQVGSTSTKYDFGASPFTFTTDTNTQYVVLYNSNNVATVVNDIQLEEGTKQNSYTPYGTTPIELCKIGDYQDYFLHDKVNDKWYLHKEIGKVVLDGSESSWIENSATKGLFQVTLSNVLNNINTINAMANWLKGNTGVNTANQTYSESINNSIATFNANRLFFRINDFRENLAGLKTFLSNNNLIAYYVYATSTTEEVTNITLINQLDALRNAESYEGQTNISQVNNDLPFIISASALKEWQESNVSTLSMVNPLSLGNTLNTQENDIQPLEINEEIEPIEVDNIEPLEEGNYEENQESI